MSVTTRACKHCQKLVTFDLNPYEPGKEGTRYWKSVYTIKPPVFEFEVDRISCTTTYHPDGTVKKTTERALKEYVFWVYCDAECSLKHHEQQRQKPV